MAEATRALLLTEEEARLLYDRLRTDSGNLTMKAYDERDAGTRRLYHELRSKVDRLSERARTLYEDG